jgi:hypothetical protein
MPPKLDGAGAAKMTTIEDALTHLRRLHGLVERMAVAVKAKEPTQLYGAQLKRAGTPMVGLLKGQFGTIADQVTAMLLAATRGGSEQLKVRTLREGIAQVRTQLEIAAARVKQNHTVDDDAAAAPASGAS